MKNAILILLLAFSLIDCTKTQVQKSAPIKETALVSVPFNIVCAGNSLTHGGKVDSADSYPAQLSRMSPYVSNGSRIVNVGINGTTTEVMQSRILTDIAPNFIPGQNNIVAAWEIGNDIYWNGTMAHAAYLNFTNYCDSVRKLNFKVVIVTLPYRDNTYMSGPITPGGDSAASYSRKLDTCNSLIRAYWRIHANGIADVQKDPRLNHYDSLYYNADHVHLTVAGYGIIASWVSRSVLAIRN